MPNLECAKLKLVILTKGWEGSGTEDDPKRIVLKYWDNDGTLLFTKDGLLEKAQC